MEAVEAGCGWRRKSEQESARCAWTRFQTTKAQIVATACPFCLQMFEDAAKAKSVEDTLKVKDIAELMADSLEVNKIKP